MLGTIVLRIISYPRYLRFKIRLCHDSARYLCLMTMSAPTFQYNGHDSCCTKHLAMMPSISPYKRLQVRPVHGMTHLFFEDTFEYPLLT